MKDYFPQSDFDSCTPPCKKEVMHPETMKKFNEAREIAGIPFVPTSAGRTKEHELAMGRKGTSSHVYDETKKARAMDIACTNDQARMKIMLALLRAGFTRIGVGKTFIHADDDPTKNQTRLWTY